MNKRPRSTARKARNGAIVVPPRTARRFYGHGLPNVDLKRLAGRLIVVEGADGSGRSTQIAMLTRWLEGAGHATAQVGLKRSTLVSEELEQAKKGNILSRSTLSLFYTTDFADQIENSILPALKAGFKCLRTARAHPAAAARRNRADKVAVRARNRSPSPPSERRW